jgi:hypothetical protein
MARTKSTADSPDATACARARGEHLGIRLKQCDVLEEPGELHPDGAGPATDVEEPASPTETHSPANTSPSCDE